MKPLAFYICMLAMLFQVVFSSTSLGDEHVSLKSKKPGGSTAKPVVSGFARRKKPQGKRNKSGVAVKEDEPKSLIELLSRKLVEIVVSYFTDETYPILVSTDSWLFKGAPGMAVDGARVYMMASFEGLKSINHPSATVEENEHRYVEFGDLQWSTYIGFSSSCDGRYVSFSHSYKVSTDRGVQTRYSSKWLAQDNELEGGGVKRIKFDSGHFPCGLLSRNGQTLYSYSGMTNVTRVYQIMEEAGKDPAAFMKLELNGMVRAASSDANRVMIADAKQLEIHDIGEDASKLVCRIDADAGLSAYAMNEDGSEAAIVNSARDELRIVKVDSVVGSKIDQPAIVTVKVPKPVERIGKLVYSDRNKLHVLHRHGGGVSLFDPSTKEFIPIETPGKGQKIVSVTISPNADYFASIQRVGKVKKSGKWIYRTIVKRKEFTTDNLRSVFGYETGKVAGTHK